MENKESELGKSLFKSRKRPSKKRKRTTTDYSSNAGTCTDSVDDNKKENDGPTTADLLLMKQAQQLRQRNRAAGIDISQLNSQSQSGDVLNHDTSSSAKTGADSLTALDSNSNGKINDVADGLKSNFSIERSVNVVQERMTKFIEDGMRKKFGSNNHISSNQDGNERNEASVNENDHDNDREQGENKVHNGGDGDRGDVLEDDIYSIPNRLKVTEKPMYDPSEGMPSAGLEETDIPVSVSTQQHERESTPLLALVPNDSAKRRKSKSQKSSVAADIAESYKRESYGDGGASVLSGNVSANFQHHRQERTHRFSQSKASEGSDRRHQQQQRSDNSNSSNHGDSAGNSTGGRRRNAHPFDAQFAERYRKRWKR